MNAGLLKKAARESLAITIVVGLGLCGIEWLFARILPAFYGEMSNNLLQLPFVRKMVAAGLGIDPSAEMGPATMMAMVWTHPVVLALIYTLAISAGTRVPAAEVDRGTIDVLLSLPVSRTGLLAAEAAVALLCGVVVIALGFLGNFVGGWPLDTQTLGTISQRLWVCTNLWALCVAVFGVSCLFSAISDRRGRASAAAIAFVVAAFVLNFLGAFSKPMHQISFLSVLDYYRPLFTLQGNVRPIRDILVLVAIGAACWGFGWLAFKQRDIRTV